MPNYKEQNNIIYVEPNYNYSMWEYDDKGINTYQFIPPTENYSIYANLEVEVRGRRINKSINTPTKLVLSWESTSDKTTINFMQGTKMPGDVNYFTTDYTDTFLKDIKTKGPSTEMFGISSIDIAYNNYMQPVVTIEFVDVRGVSLFAQRAYYETATGTTDTAINVDGENVANSFFQCFFTTPFPKFNLIVKGFYGKAISYQLLCSDFRARFKSQEGNFSCTAKFIGYHFAFLGDVMMNAIIAAPYSDYIGRDYWRTRNFQIPSYDGSLKPMPTIPTLFSRLKQAKADSERAINSSAEMQEYEEQKALLETSTPIKQKYDAYMKAVVEVINRAAKSNFIDYRTNEKVKVKSDLCKYDSNFSVIKCVVQTPNGVWNNADVLGRQLKIIGTGSYGGNTFYYDEYKDAIEEKRNAFIDALKNSSEFPEDAETYDVLYTQKSISFTKDTILSIPIGYQVEFKDVINEIENIQGSYTIYYYKSKIVEWLNKDKSSGDTKQQAEKLEEIQEQIEDKINDFTTESLQFIPSVENFTKIVIAHFETFAYMLWRCGEDIINDDRTCSNMDLPPEDLSDVDTNKTEDSVPPFPRLTEIIDKDGQRNRVESWVGRDGMKGYFRERDLVHGILNGIRKVEEIIRKQEDDESIGTETDTNKFSLVKYPLTVYDLVADNDIYGQVDTSDVSSLLSIVAMRAIDIFFLDYKDTDDDSHPVDARTLGVIEADNLKAKVDIPKDMVEKLSGLSGHGNSIVEMLYGTENEFVKKLNGGQGPWPWSTDASSNDGMLSDSSYLNICKDTKTNAWLLPCTNLSWPNIIDNTIKSGCDKAYASIDFLDTKNSVDNVDNKNKIKQNLFTIELGMSNINGIITDQVAKGPGLDGLAEKWSKQAEYKKDKYLESGYVNKDRLEDIVVHFYNDAKDIKPGEKLSILPVSPKLIKDLNIEYFGGGKDLDEFRGSGDVESIKKNKEGEKVEIQRIYEDAYDNYLDNMNTNDYIIIEFPYVDENFNVGSTDKSSESKTLGVGGGPHISCFGSLLYYMQTTLEQKAFMFLGGLQYYINYEKILADIADDSKQILNIPLPAVLFAGGLIYFSEEVISNHKLPLNGVSFPDELYTKYLSNLHIEVRKNLKDIFKEWATGNNLTWINEPKIWPFKKFYSGLEIKLKNGGDVVEFLKNIDEFEDDEDWIDEGIFKGKGYNKNLMRLLCDQLQDNFFANYLSIDEDCGKKWDAIKLYGDNFGGMRLANRDGGPDVIHACHFALAACTFVKHAKFFNKNDGYDIKPNKNKLTQFFEGFIEEISKELEPKDASSFALAAEPTNTTEDIKVAVYRYAKLLYDKWISYIGNDEDEFYDNFGVSKFFDDPDHYFVFIDTFYNKANNKIMNLGYFINEIKSCFGRNQYSLLSFLSSQYSHNKFSFNCVNNFLDLNNAENVKSLFDVIPVSLMGKPKEYPNFVVMLCDEPSSHLDIPDSDYPDDSFDISNFDDMTKWPEPLKARNEGVYDGYMIPSFGVTYGQMYQSYFQDVEVGMDNPMITEQSIKAQWEIASAANADSNSGDRANVVYYGQDLYSVFSNYSYTCNVTMLGCAYIQPLMYFCLNNIPMFRGTYIIQRVQHTITPGNMITKFTGTRMANVSTRKVQNYMVRANGGGNGIGSEITPENRAANIDNDCTYKVYPLEDDVNSSFALGEIKHYSKTQQVDAYINAYAQWAVDDMRKTGILASITLAQGLLESGNGLSKLATQANNHFGIKAYDDWHGDVYYATDDCGSQKCKFKKYDNVGQSYEDHSKLISQGEKYRAQLENYYGTTDYRSFAIGLKAAGYATDPNYAEALIGMIESYGLAKYDKMAIDYGFIGKQINYINKANMSIQSSVGTSIKTSLSLLLLKALDKSLASSSMNIKIGYDKNKTSDNALWITNPEKRNDFDAILDVILRGYGNYVSTVGIIVKSDTKSTPEAIVCGVKENSNRTVIAFTRLKDDSTTEVFCQKGGITSIDNLSENFTRAIYKKYKDSKNLVLSDAYQLSNDVVDAIFAKHGEGGSSPITSCAELVRTSSGGELYKGGSVILSNGGTIINGMIGNWNVQQYVNKLHEYQKSICRIKGVPRKSYGGCSYCTGVINRALQDTGYPKLGGGEPYSLYDNLRNSSDFVEVQSGRTNVASSSNNELEYDRSKIQAGDICTMWTCRGTCKGFMRHTCSYDGTQWISDYLQGSRACAYRTGVLEWHIMRHNS